jgi:hypothetical protein
MDITVRVVIDPGDGGPVTSHDVATLTRGDLTVATAGLHLAEAHQIVSGIQQHLVAAQATAAVEDAGQCADCGRPLAHKDGRTIVLRSLFGTLRIPSPRLKTCPCRSRRPAHLQPADQAVVQAYHARAGLLRGQVRRPGLLPSPRRQRLRTRRLHHRLRHPHRDLPTGQAGHVMDTVHPVRQRRHRGHLRYQRLRTLPRPDVVHHRETTTAVPATQGAGRGPDGHPNHGTHHRVPNRLRPPCRGGRQHLPSRRPRRPTCPVTGDYPRPASTTSSWPARSTCSVSKRSGTAHHWTDEEPAT